MPRTSREVVFVDGVRTPFGKAGEKGMYAQTRADDLVIKCIRELMRRQPNLPPESVDASLFEDSGTHTNCPWKGEASYFHVVAGDATNEDAAWYYPAPKDAAKNIAGHVAFWRGVEVTR